MIGARVRRAEATGEAEPGDSRRRPLRRPTAWFAAGLTLFAGCAPSRPPASFEQLDQVAASPGAEESSTWAPQAAAQAERLRDSAKLVWARGDEQQAALLAEQALAAYEHAWVLTRLALAEERQESAQVRLRDRDAELEQARAQLDELLARAARVQLRIDVRSRAEPPSALASAEGAARQALAAKALVAQADLLCAAASLVRSDSAAVELAERVAELQRRWQEGEPPAVDAAAKIRAECAGLLGAAEGPARAAQSYQSDRLLAELGRAGLEPWRDARGVGLTLRALFLGSGDELQAGGTAQLEALARVALAHPGFAVLAIGHDGDVARSERRAQTAAKFLRARGVTRVAARGVGPQLPVASRIQRDAAARNRRIELVFVAGSSGQASRSGASAAGAAL